MEKCSFCFNWTEEVVLNYYDQPPELRVLIPILWHLEEVMKPKDITKRYLRKDFIFDLIANLLLPEVTRVTGSLEKSVRVGAAYNLIFYLLVSHFVGGGMVHIVH